MTQNRLQLIGILFAAASLFGSSAVAEKSRPQTPERTLVGNGEALEVVPDLSLSAPDERADGTHVWRKTIHRKEASFVKIHLVDVQLRTGDTLRLLSQSGRVVEEILHRGPKDRGSFWSLSAFGESLELEFEFRAAYTERPPFSVDRVIFGTPNILASLPPGSPGSPESVCAPPDFEDVVCYETDLPKWSNVQASVGVMSVGGNADNALFCSGSNISPDSYILTNQHCVETQNVCDNTEFVFRHYRTGCGDGSPPTEDWVSYRCDQVVAQSPFVSCEHGLEDLDFTLASVIGDPNAIFGAVHVDPAPIVSGEDIYIIQHPDGRPHEITHGGGTDVLVDGTVLRYFNTLDTEDGSSGSPIFRESDDRLVGLHHCGGCDTEFGNRGMLISDIYPEISDFTCTAGIALRGAGFQDLVEESGNGDSLLDPGETWLMTPQVRNASCEVTATNVAAEAAVSAGSDGPILISGPQLDFGEILPGTTGAASSPIAIEIGTDFPCGGSIVLDLLGLVAENGPPEIDALEFASAITGDNPQTTLFFEDFSDPSDWTIENGGTGTGPAETWTTENPGNRNLSLTEPFMISDSDSLGAGGEMDESLISPPVDVSGFSQLVLQFTHDFTWYNGSLDEQADVEIRRSPVDPWILVSNYSGAARIGTETIDISAVAAGATELQIRFHYYNAAYEWWWAIDDVFVLGNNGFQCSDVEIRPEVTVTSPGCPGPVLIEISDLTPFGPVAIGIANELGSVQVPNGPCAGTQLDIGPPRFVQQVAGDANGFVSRPFDALAPSCGSYVQILDLTTCQTSATAQVPETNPRLAAP